MSDIFEVYDLIENQESEKLNDIRDELIVMYENLDFSEFIKHADRLNVNTRLLVDWYFRYEDEKNN